MRDSKREGHFGCPTSGHRHDAKELFTRIWIDRLWARLRLLRASDRIFRLASLRIDPTGGLHLQILDSMAESRDFLGRPRLEGGNPGLGVSPNFVNQAVRAFRGALDRRDLADGTPADVWVSHRSGF
jgi:hypothetical protein